MPPYEYSEFVDYMRCGSSGTGTCAQVWYEWNVRYDGNGRPTAFTTNASDPWGAWVHECGGSTETTYDRHGYMEVWVKWNSNSATGHQTYMKLSQPRNAPPLEAHVYTEEELAERSRLAAERQAEGEARVKRWEEEEKARKEKLREIEAVAERLLLSYLDDEQTKDYEAAQAFHVISQEGKRYRIERKRSGNVLELEKQEGQEVAVARYCLHSVAHVPLGDDMLVALIMLRSSEKEYKQIANRTRFSSPLPVSRLRAEGDLLGSPPEPTPAQEEAA